MIDIPKNESPGVQFVGFTVAGGPVSRVTCLTEGPFDQPTIDRWGIDDVQYSTVAPSVTTVPEPSSFALIIVGVAPLLSLSRRTRHTLHY